MRKLCVIPADWTVTFWGIGEEGVAPFAVATHPDHNPRVCDLANMKKWGQWEKIPLAPAGTGRELSKAKS